MYEQDDQNLPMPDFRATSMSVIWTVIKWLLTQNLAKPWQLGNSRVEFALKVIPKSRFGQALSLLRSH